MLLSMNFSSRTTSLDVQRNLEANVEKRTKDNFGPPLGKKLLVFIDDMNMPQVGVATSQVYICSISAILWICMHFLQITAFFLLHQICITLWSNTVGYIDITCPVWYTICHSI